MALPKKLKAFNGFVDGRGYMGIIEEATLPKLTRKMEEYRGAGMDGTVDLDMGAEKMEAELTMGSMVTEMLETYGVCNLDGVKLRIMGAMEADDDCSMDAVEVVMHGRWTEIDPGNWKEGESTTTKYSGTLSYFKYRVNGVDIIEIDVPRMIFKVNGVDKYLARRLALGLLY